MSRASRKMEEVELSPKFVTDHSYLYERTERDGNLIKLQITRQHKLQLSTMGKSKGT